MKSASRSNQVGDIHLAGLSQVDQPGASSAPIITHGGGGPASTTTPKSRTRVNLFEEDKAAAAEEDILKRRGDLPFRLPLTGYAGHFRVEPRPPITRETALDALPDLILPPAIPPETKETIKKDIVNKYLIPSLDHEDDKVEHCGKFWDFEWFGTSLFIPEPSQPRLLVVPKWEPPFKRGKEWKKNVDFIQKCDSSDPSQATEKNWIPDFEEIEVINAGENAKNSSSLLRKPGPFEDFVRGSTKNHPFQPGGAELSRVSSKNVPEAAMNGDWLRELLEGGPLQTKPPGFKQGLDLGAPESSFFSNRGGIDGDDALTNSSKINFNELFKQSWEQTESESEGEEGKPDEKKSDDEKVEAEQDNSDLATEASTAEDEIHAIDAILKDMKQYKHVSDDLKRPHPKKKDEIGLEWAVRVEKDVAEKFSELVPDMALEFPFELDKFQKEAIYHLERGDSVFVSAHTSAGKTVVAEYAMALATKHCTRAIYTSPIKTISNQKYRDFSDRFDVGLLTGDISLKPEAPCLIMTTEILRSMLYKGADIVRDIEWVIFDEVHYVNDAERGVVWEEVIIMLPDHVNMVLLSATVPNTFEFADWIGRTKQKKIYVTGTSRRPVPLEHCLFFSNEFYNICDCDTFLPQGVKAAKDALARKNSNKGGSAQGRGNPGAQGRGNLGHQGRGGGHSSGRSWSGGHKDSSQMGSGVPGQKGGSGGGWRSETSQWYSLVNSMFKKGLLPMVVFCFSKNRCDKSADSLTTVDFTTKSEKSEIRVFCDKAFSRLKGSDRQLPQVVRVQDLLQRGLGVHHAGLLPIVKEVVEMLFCRGLIKVLFSTETFAMGVNAPARTVAFHSVRKHDGKNFRQLLPGEYTQMAGRAGRRGLDKVGTVILICWDDIPEEGDLRGLLTGKPTKLESQFRLTYNMILSLLRVEGLKVEDMLKRSFAEFHAQRALPEQQRQLQKGEGELSRLNATIDCILGDPTIEEYYEQTFESEKFNLKIQEAIMNSRGAQQALTPGRVVVVKIPLSGLPTLGVIVKGPTGNVKTSIVLAINRGPIPSLSPTVKGPPESKPSQVAEEGYIISRKGNRGLEDEYSVIGKVSRKGSGVVNVTLPYYGSSGGTGYVAMEVDSSSLLSICKTRIQVDTARLLEDVNASAYSRTVQRLLQLETEFPGQDPPPLDPVKDLKINDVEAVEQYQRWKVVMEKRSHNKCYRCPKLHEHYEIMKAQHALKEKVRQLKYKVSDAALQQMPDFQQRIEVMQEVGCIDADLVVQLKGRVACEINSGDELIATECLFDNQFVDLEPSEAVALLSSLVFQQKDASEPSLTPRLKAAKERLLHTALWLGNVQAKHGLPINPEDYAQNSLKFGLMEVVYEWAKGTPFSKICELTDVPEGSIVRTIVRLDETCREFKNAARILGDSALFQKMDDASNAIKRDIVFAASLYVTGVPSST